MLWMALSSLNKIYSKSASFRLTFHRAFGESQPNFHWKEKTTIFKNLATLTHCSRCFYEGLLVYYSNSPGGVLWFSLWGVRRGEEGDGTPRAAQQSCARAEVLDHVAWGSPHGDLLGSAGSGSQCPSVICGCCEIS